MAGTDYQAEARAVWERGVRSDVAMQAEIQAALAAAEERGRRRGVEERDELRAALEKIANASYTEFRPFVEHYGLDPNSEGSIYPGKGNVHREHATEREWEAARGVARYLQAIASAAIAPRDSGKDP